MHISDGVLSTPVCIGGYVAAIGIAWACTKKMEMKELPQISVITAVFFVATLISVPLGPTSVHLILNGLVGVILGTSAFLSIFLGLVLQSLLFQHGGVTTIGCNAIMMGVSALICAFIFNPAKKSTKKKTKIVVAAVAGALGTILSGCFLALFLSTSGEDFFGVAKFALLTHIPVMVIEAAVTASAVAFFLKVKPEMVTKVVVLSNNKMHKL